MSPVIISQLHRTFRALAYPGFRIYAAGQLLGTLAFWLQTTAVSWLVLELSDNSPGALGVVTALQFVPVMLLTLWSGKLADRYDKRKLLIAANAAFAVFAVIFAVIVAAGVVELWHVFVAALFLGIASAVETPVRQSFVSELVELRLLPNALALSAATFNVARISGPALAGVLLALVGARIVTVLPERVAEKLVGTALSASLTQSSMPCAIEVRSPESSVPRSARMRVVLGPPASRKTLFPYPPLPLVQPEYIKWMGVPVVGSTT